MAIVVDAARPSETVEHGITFLPSVADDHIETVDTDGGDSAPVDGVVGAVANAADGTDVSVVLPQWIVLDIVSCVGATTTLEDGSLRVNDTAAVTIQIQSTVLHSYGRSVVFGYAVNNPDATLDEVTEFGRVQVNSNEPVTTYSTRKMSVTAGDLYTFFISSDFEWAQFRWEAVQLMVVEWQAPQHT